MISIIAAMSVGDVTILNSFFDIKHPEIYREAQFKFRGLWFVALAGLLTSSLFFAFILRLAGAMSGFLLLPI
ncbi:MAG: hypothetical protein EF812_01585 [Methanosarcinales archaeon]|nr:MAG: hypothetical protein EF812_01585 [Methanosarcinales archaeon]